MTLATLDPVSGNQTGVWIVIALLAVLAICACLYQHERRSDRHGRTLAAHDRQLGLLAGRIEGLAVWLGVELNDPAPDDSPGREGDLYAQELETDDPTTDEFPAQPGLPTEPMAVVDPTPAVQARRDAAWDEQRPSPVPRGKSADWVEEAIKGFNFSGRDR